MQNVTPADLERIENKLDQIIDFFNIGKTPRRSRKDIKSMAEAVVLDLQKKSRGLKK